MGEHSRRPMPRAQKTTTRNQQNCRSIIEQAKLKNSASVLIDGTYTTDAEGNKTYQLALGRNQKYYCSGQLGDRPDEKRR